MKTMGVNITTIAYLRGLIIEIGWTIVLMVVEAQGLYTPDNKGWEKTSCSVPFDVMLKARSDFTLALCS